MHKIVVEIDADLQDLMPGYLQTKHNELASIAAALSAGDFEAIRVIGHNMKGNGSAYGLVRISEIGEAIEREALHKSIAKIEACILELLTYLNQITFVFVEE